jgi:hypothetical protein
MDRELRASLKRVAFVGAAAVAVVASPTPLSAQNMLPVCPLIATGGTIASKIDPVKKAPVPVLSGEDLVATVPDSPGSVEIAAVLNMSNPVTAPQLKELEGAVRSKGLPFRLFDVRSRDDIERAFIALDGRPEAVVVGLEGLTQEHRKMIAELAAKHRLPTIYGGREFVEAGGLMFYGPSFANMYHRAATYVDKILKGTKPADLPVEQPTRFELVINLRAAKAIDLVVPATLLAIADEVIE